MHQKILRSFASCKIVVKVPECYQYVTTSDQWWSKEQISCFPENYQPCNALHNFVTPAFPARTAALNSPVDNTRPRVLALAPFQHPSPRRQNLAINSPGVTRPDQQPQIGALGIWNTFLIKSLGR
jgi:hypothetical protein